MLQSIKFSMSGPYNKDNDSFEGLKDINVDVYKIKAEETFETLDGRIIKAGDYGGYIEKGSNLSHEGACWIMPGNVVIGESVISGNTIVAEGSCIANSVIGGDSYIYFTAIGSSEINGDIISSAKETPNIIINTEISGNAILLNGAVIKNTVVDPDALIILSSGEVNQCDVAGLNTVFNANAFRVVLNDVHLAERELWHLSYDIFEGQQDYIRELFADHGFMSDFIMEYPAVRESFTKFKQSQESQQQFGDQVLEMDDLFNLIPADPDVK